MVKAADYLASSSSLVSSENPYATIKDPPSPTSKNTESSYMEMKSPTRRDSAYAEISDTSLTNNQKVDKAGKDFNNRFDFLFLFLQCNE